MIRSILKAVLVGWVAKKFLNRDKNEPGHEPPRREPRRV